VLGYRKDIMSNNNNIKNNKFKVTAAATTTLFLFATMIIVAGVVSMSIGVPIRLIQPAQAFIDPNTNPITERSARAPVVVTGDNIYVAWWTNNTANKNEEVMFRASNDGGATFNNKTNLSNTPNADSWRVEIAGEGANVIVTWWETNQTSDIPVARISTDGGQTFGPLLRIGMNGSISQTEGQGGAEGIGNVIGGILGGG
jgi:hypothetical protein